ncbi:MAG: hypothetical protein WCJ84_06155 [Candidatus Peregrinibacteria bacterium]
MNKKITGDKILEWILGFLIVAIVPLLFWSLKQQNDLEWQVRISGDQAENLAFRLSVRGKFHIKTVYGDFYEEKYEVKDGCVFFKQNVICSKFSVLKMEN